MKTFWLNIGALDRDMDLSERKQILSALEDQGVEVRATFNYLEKKQELSNLSQVWYFRLGKDGIIRKLSLVIQQQLLLARNLDVDVVVLRAWKLHETLPLWWFWKRLLRKRKPKFVLDLRTVPVDIPNNRRGAIKRYRFESSIKFALRYFDGMTVITQKLKNDIEGAHDRYGKTIAVWSTGVDTSRFDPDRVSDLRAQLGLDDRFVIIHHGIFSLNRGLTEAIEAVALLRDSYPQIVLLLLGKGPGLETFQRLVTEKGLQDNVKILPPVDFDEVPKYIKTADVGILPFPDIEWWNTCSSIKLNEYLSMGKPVIVTDIAAHRAVLGQSPCGFFADDNKPETLAAVIELAISRKRDIPDLGRLARKLACDKLTWERQAGTIKRYFEELVG